MNGRVASTVMAAGVLMGAPVTAFAQRSSPPTVVQTDLEAQLQALPRLPAAQRKVVTIYEFRNGVGGVTNLALTDMFTNALVKSGAFLVAERQRLNQDIAAEKALNAGGRSTGDTAQHRIAGAQYIFEGVVSEANLNESASESLGSLGGMSLGKRRQRAQIAIDVRVLDADSGLVMDTVTISKEVNGGGASVGNAGSLAQSLVNLGGGGAIPLAPDVSTSSSHSEGMDRALRDCVDAAVLELVRRYGGHGAS